MDGKATETGGETFGREDLLNMRRAFMQGQVVQVFTQQRVMEKLVLPEDHAGMEKAAKALGALTKVGCEVFAAALDEPDEKTTAEPAEEDEMNGDRIRRPADDDLDGWRALLERKLVRLAERRGVKPGGPERGPEDGHETGGGLEGPGLSGAEAAGRYVA